MRIIAVVLIITLFFFFHEEEKVNIIQYIFWINWRSKLYALTLEYKVVINILRRQESFFNLDNQKEKCVMVRKNNIIIL